MSADPQPPALSVTVVVVAFQSGDFLQPCVDSLAAQTFADFEVVIADNGSPAGSPDDSVARLRLPDARFRVRDMGANLGFAAANNRVAAASRAQFLALLNPDAVAEPDWLHALVEAARADAGLWAVGGVQVRMDDAGRLDGVGDVWHAAGLAWRAGEGWGAARLPGDGAILGPCGGAALYRRDAFLRVGGFDERFFCYCEDVDMALRLRLAGGRARRVSAARVRHAGSGITGRASDFTLFHGHRNRIWVFLKTTPGVWLWLLAPFHLGFNALYLLLAVRRGFPRPIWRAYRAAWRGRAAMLAHARALPPGAFRRLLPIVVWAPWAPWSRTLKPAPDPAPDAAPTPARARPRALARGPG